MSNLVDRYGNRIDKSIPMYSNETVGLGDFSNSTQKEPRRGVQVYNVSQIQGVTGRGKDGQLMRWGYEEPYFYLTVQQRIEMFKASSPIFGVVTNRMQRLAGMNFNILPVKRAEEELAEEMKDSAKIYNEFRDSTELKDLMMKANIVKYLKERLPDLKDDLSNFSTALLRWKRRIKYQTVQTAEDVKGWLLEPTNGVMFEDFIKKFVFDLMIHGSCSIYKSEERGKLENFDVLPGGTVYRIKEAYFTGRNAYVQIVPGITEPQIMFDNEVAYSEYIPTSARNYGMIPLEALINKVAESLFFDKLMAEQADGTKPPEKLIIVTDRNPFGSFDSDLDKDIPIDTDEQKRIEQKVNTPTKNAIMTFSGNDATVVDLSRENTMQMQSQRQKDIREEVALVFGATPMEMNLTGSEHTSGRETSDTQMEIMQGRGIAPIARIIENVITRNILPFKWGSGLIFEFEVSKNEMEEKQKDQLSLQTGEMTYNEIREKYNKNPFEGEEYDKPQGTGQQQPGQSEMNPQYMRQV